MEIIEKGFEEILKRIEEDKDKKEELSAEVLKNQSKLLERMGDKAAPLVKTVGINMLLSAKSNIHGEMFEKRYTDKKMFVLGKTEPMPYRPDDASKKVDSQFCILSEDKKFYEIMYSSSEFATDSYLREIPAEEALSLYGTEIIFMIYKAFHQYLKEEDELVSALGKTIAFIQ
ncbi:MAG: hypothetical protein JXQ82_00745, partial [Methanomicrobiaceae archaeon]|nr:hypothetical protein [Methanomicrobiaceae archaeon]